MEQEQFAEAEPLVDRAIAIFDRAGTPPAGSLECYLLRGPHVGWQSQTPQRGPGRPPPGHAAGRATSRPKLRLGPRAGRELRQVRRMPSSKWSPGRPNSGHERSPGGHGARPGTLLLDEMNQSGVDLAGRPIRPSARPLDKRDASRSRRPIGLEKQLEAAGRPAADGRSRNWPEQARLQAGLATARDAALSSTTATSGPASPGLSQSALGRRRPAPAEPDASAAWPASDGLLLTYLLGDEGGYLLVVGRRQGASGHADRSTNRPPKRWASRPAR